MKNQAMLKTFKRPLVMLSLAAAILTSCNNNDEPQKQSTTPTGMLTVSDQTISQNMINVGNVTLNEDGWVVVHASNSDGSAPMVPDIISEPLMVKAGSNDNLSVTISDVSNLKDGDKVWVMLHTDDGAMGSYEFDGSSGLDAPIMDASGQIVMTPITISSPKITSEDQIVNENMITISEVKAAVDGWLVIHGDDGSGKPGAVLGETMVKSGMNTDVMVDLGKATFAGGEKLFPMLHVDSPADGKYGFPDNGDAPEVFGKDVIVTSIGVKAPAGTIMASDQILQGNMLSVSEITMNATGWVVVHASNATNDGPMVPGIVSTPVQLQVGTTSNVEIMLNADFIANTGDKLYVMLHTDNGVIGQYEFDGANGFDGPITTQAISVLAPSGSFTASNQIVSENMINVETITVDQPSWVVIHRDNGLGSFQAPDIISQPVALDAGTTDNVQISLKDGEMLTDGETLWIMLHNDDGMIGSYEFDGLNGLDLPITYSSIDIEAPSIAVSDQVVTNAMVKIDQVKAGVDGWVVIHADDGSGNPGTVLGETYVNAGTSSDVMVDLRSNTVTAGQKLFPMLHVDSPADQTYGFPDNGDGPEKFNSDIVVVSFTTL